MASKKSGGGTRIGVEFGLGNKQFREAMAEISNDLKQADLDFKLLQAQGGAGWAETVEGLTAKTEMLTSQMLDQSRQTEMLAAEYERTVAAQGAASSAAMQLETRLKQSQIKEAELQNQIKATNTALDEQKKSMEGTGKSSGGLESIMGKLGGGIGGVGGQMMSAVATGNLYAAGLELASQAAQKLISSLIDMGKTIDDTYDGIIINTGAAGDELDSINDSFRKVGTSGPNELGKASTAISDYNTRLNYTGSALEKMTEQTLNLERMTGANLQGVIKDTSAIVLKYGLNSNEASGYLDALFVASQKTGASVDTLAGQMRQNSDTLSAFGLSVTKQIALLGSFEKAGVDTNIAMRGMQQELAQLVQAGKNPERMLEQYTQRIKTTKSEQEALSMAIEFFGTKAGPQMAAAIRSGVLDLQDLTNAINNSGGAVNRTAIETDGLFETFDKMGNLLTNIFGPALNMLFDAFDALIQPIVWVLEVIEKVTGAIYSAIEAIKGFFTVAKTETNTLAESTKNSGEKAAKGIEEVGDATEKASKAVTSSVSNMSKMYERYYGALDEVERKEKSRLDLLRTIAKYGQENIASLKYENGVVIGFSLKEGTTPKYANGTEYSQGGLARVGERGPEDVVLPRGARVISAEKSARSQGGGNATLNVSFDKVSDVVRLVQTVDNARRLGRMKNPTTATAH